MAKVSILITLLSQLLCTLLEVSAQQSPCPQYFTYITNAATYEVMGQIEIPSPPKNVELHLKVTLSIAAALPTKYVGKLDLAQSKEESVQRVQQNWPLLYYIYFPLREPLSLLTGIWFNNQKYCSGPDATGRIVTFITLEHTLYPPNIPVYMMSSTPKSVYMTSPVGASFYTMSPAPTSVYTSPAPAPVYTSPAPALVYTMSQAPTPVFTASHLPNQPVTIQYPIRKTPQSTIFSDEISNPFLNNNNECGRSNDINLLISNGMKTSPGQWPWLVAIFFGEFNLKVECAGSILTNKHIITAARCVDLNELRKRFFNINSTWIFISLGRYQLHHWTEEGSLNIQVQDIKLHPDYQDYSSDADLAILTLMTPVEFSPTIKPICMWHGSINLENVINKIGTVVGWGNGLPPFAEPQMVKMPIVSQEACLRSNRGFRTATSNRTFCAGLQDGSGPCNGDSGSGMVLYDNTTHRYYLRGIVSIAIGDAKICGLNNYIVFVDVIKHLLWIQQQISAT